MGIQVAEEGERGPRGLQSRCARVWRSITNKAREPDPPDPCAYLEGAAGSPTPRARVRCVGGSVTVRRGRVPGAAGPQTHMRGREEVPKPRDYLEGARGPRPWCVRDRGARLAAWVPGRRGVQGSGAREPRPALGVGGEPYRAGTHCLNIFSMSLICFLENSLNSV